MHIILRSNAQGHEHPSSQSRTTETRWAAVCVVALLVLQGGGAAAQSGQAMFGNTWSRNMVSSATGLPATWNLETGENVRWSQPLGSQSYAGPVVFGGKVFVGTNNEGNRNPNHVGDRGVLMAFDEATGDFLWQSVHSKFPEAKLHDWPLQGVQSTPVIEGDRLWYVSNRAELVCIDTEGFRDGENDGPFNGEPDTSLIEADVVWSYDLIGELDVFPHGDVFGNARGSPLVVGDLVYASTGNGVDQAHVNVPIPYAPSLVALNKNTGEHVWDDATPDEGILHGTWSNPAYAVVQGRAMVVFPEGDGWVRAFDPLTGAILWEFDANPKDSVWRLGGAGTRNNILSTPVIYDDKVYIGVGQEPEHGEAPGHFWVIDATGEDDVTDTAVVWHRGGEDFNRTISTAAIKDDIVYIADLSGFLYALNAQNGQLYWTYDTFAAVWSSPFLADGKVYLGDEDGDLAVFREGQGLNGQPELLSENNLGAAIYATPVAVDGTLFVATRNRLFAFGEDEPCAGTDTDSDGVPDDCDNCSSVFNPVLGTLGQSPRQPFQTTTGGQLDSDADGFGNICDADFDGVGSVVGGVDLGHLLGSFNKDRSSTACGAASDQRCEEFDLDNSGQFIGGSDLGRAFQLFNNAPGPKCDDCPLTCEGPGC